MKLFDKKSYLPIKLIWLISIIHLTNSTTHWKVTENGRIESIEESSLTLLRPYDLAALLKQNERVKRLGELKDIITSSDLINLKDSNQEPNSVHNYQENFYNTDPDCIKAGQQLTKFSFFETHLISWHTYGLYLPKEAMEIKKSQLKNFKNPFCDIVNLPFNMKTFNHLESIQSKDNITMLPETDLLANILIQPEDFYGHLIHIALKKNSSSWVYHSMAADYFRIKGDYVNAIKCLQRSVYFVPRNYYHIPTLSFSNMLHKLNFLNDSLAIALTAASIDTENALLAYHLGNIYVTLGELNSSREWYERAEQLDPDFKQSYYKKHAIICHLKLEEYLETQHSNLKKKLDELKDYQAITDEWFEVSSKVDLEKSSSNRREFTKHVYDDFLLHSKSVICEWKPNTFLNNNDKSKIECLEIPIHYSYLPFNNQTLFKSVIKDLSIVRSKKIRRNPTDLNQSILKLNICEKDIDYNNQHNYNNDNNDNNNNKNDEDIELNLKQDNNLCKQDNILNDRILIQKMINSKLKPPTKKDFISDFF